ncbi:MDR family MFS transporter [Clostridium cylindrosporum]|uniref:Arabinose efflux permease n=1 Tax=Clostridium cylindrosporum DSM 605 TaxID=1121307 RepID=A0A0J8DGA0_CLOCY|nr:MDR family MFS transporter [Clostridium cylindrosporum]KMT23264.1 arabinose efflux permease [Clostridium cylindrosporum DSM 605]
MKKWIMISLMLVTSLSAMEATIVSTAIPSIANSLSGIELVSWIYAIYMLTTAVSTPIYGKLADLFGRKNVIMFGTITFLIGSTLCGLAGNMSQLIIFRAIQGIGAGAIMPITMTIIGDLHTEQQERVKAQGWISAVWGISGVIGPLLGGFLVDALSWHYIFFINLPFGILSLFILMRQYHENLKKEKHYIDYPGAITFSLSIIALLYSLLSGSQNQDWNNPLLIGLFISSLVLFFVFIFIEKRSPEPLIPFNLFKNFNLSTVYFLTLFLGGILISVIAYLPIWTQEIWNKSATQAGIMLMPLPVCWTIASIFSGQIVGKIKPKYIVIIGTFILSFASFLLFSMNPSSKEFLIYIVMGLLGVGMGITTPILMLFIQNAVTNNKRGIAISLNTFINTFSQTLGAALFGVIFNISIHRAAASQTNLFSGVHTIFSITMLLAFISFSISWLFVKKQSA